MTAEDVIVYSRWRLCQWVGSQASCLLFQSWRSEPRAEVEYVGGKPRENIGGRLDGALSKH
jgi:hypothetical protein